VSLARRRAWSAAGAVAVLLACGLPAAAAPASSAAGPNPFAGVRFFVDPDSNARRQARAWRRDSPRKAALMNLIARRAQADWFGAPSPAFAAVRARVGRIRRAGALPVLVAYGIPRRDCGGHSRGGARSAAAYRRWIRGFAAGIGDRRAVVVLEPDALGSLDCLSGARRRERLGLVGYAIGMLTARPGVSLYVDAGHSRWQPASVMAARLRAVGAERARGVALNVANFRRGTAEVRYGRALAAAIPGLRAVIDSSRNGRGPAGTAWCNPPGRGLGRSPTAVRGHDLVDAYLWIKRPGESDGSCNGGPPAGIWWPQYALGLARRAR
jgi:endoglucanase